MVIGRLRSDDIYNQVSHPEIKEGFKGEDQIDSQVNYSTMKFIKKNK